MMPTMSDLGLSSRSGKKNEDEERRDKMRRVLKNIGRRKGRVSQDGIARVGRRVGLDIDIDHDPAEARARNVGNRSIALAGERLLVEVNLKQHAAQKVDVLLLEGAGTELEEFSDPAGKVLLNDLKVSEGILLQSSLDRFARNLNRLARIDILGKTAHVNCFRAIYGLYKSLEKLHNMEKEAVKVQQGSDVSNADVAAADEVLRKRSGKPTVHGNERIGLALEYWTAAKSSAGKQDDTPMEVDGAEKSQATQDSQPDVYRLQIEAESSPAPMHAALRISDAWLPETFEVPAPDSGESIPWQDPPPTYATDTTKDSQGNDVVVEGSERVPDLRFVAKLDPPVVLPWNMVNILSEVGIELPPIGQIPDYYDALLNTDGHTLSARAEPIEADQRVLAVRDGQETDRTHRYVLDVSKPDHGYKLEKLYFSHPRQLVSMLPVLRQWAQVGALIHSAFGGNRNTLPKTRPATPSANGGHPNGYANGVHSDNMDLDGVGEPTASQNEQLLVNIGLSALPQPTLSVTFPDSTSTKIGNTIFQIMPNASLAVTSYDGMDEKGDSPAQDGSQSERAKKLARALEVCGDLGVWIEWMREV